MALYILSLRRHPGWPVLFMLAGLTFASALLNNGVIDWLKPFITSIVVSLAALVPITCTAWTMRHQYAKELTMRKEKRSGTHHTQAASCRPGSE